MSKLGSPVMSDAALGAPWEPAGTRKNHYSMNPPKGTKGKADYLSRMARVLPFIAIVVGIGAVLIRKGGPNSKNNLEYLVSVLFEASLRPLGLVIVFAQYSFVWLVVVCILIVIGHRTDRPIVSFLGSTLLSIGWIALVLAVPYAMD